MQIFYAPDIEGSLWRLDENESRHLIRVLRMVKGDVVKLIDGRGNLYTGIIKNPDQRGCLIEITEEFRNFESRKYRLHIAISPLKNPERFEWFVEKSVEIGVDEITPLLCRNTEKTGIKTQRINNLIISAMKQSLKATLTKLNEPCEFVEFIRRGSEGVRLIAHCDSSTVRQNISEVYKKNGDALILIGPEGDFTKEETLSAINQDFKPVHLGPSRLRTETAGIAACHSVYFLNL
jgi:16S rRNA (uracil1498-N3)-methyltransferase